MSTMNDGQRPERNLDEALADFGAALREALHQPKDMPESLLLRAASDPLFMNALMARRDDAAALDAWLEEAGRHPPEEAGPPSAILFVRATQALVRWGLGGFRRVGPEAFAQRLDACLRCPHLRRPSERLLYQMTGNQEQPLCGLCGCTIVRKARLQTEDCPDAHPINAGMSRWGDPISSSST
ncbi:hypothetical protein [Cystobacter fuscus]|uniref:hypothetical protein n=1 Tax=Cystobacter fuscus TaxID=43 RepID=UPI002B2B3968|nr:hypothetical protein F0U63_16275 [Cystobacter fuscus]